MIKLRYEISTGRLYDGPYLIGEGYSGVPEARNDPLKVAMKAHGPIPPGVYRVQRGRFSATTGPLSMRLIPVGGQEMHGRSDFLIHGDDRDSTASTGCVIMSRVVREGINSMQKIDSIDLTVVE